MTLLSGVPEATSVTGPLSRRRILGAASGILLAAPLGALPASAAAAHTTGSLPAHDIEQIIGADGQLSNGVLAIDIVRDDIDASLRGIRFLPGFQLQHELAFQAIENGHAICNGDLALRAAETQTVLDALLTADLVIQAFHQHLYDLQPQVWFIHFRGVGDPAHLAHRVRYVINHTSTKLPQGSPAHPRTPLPADRLAALLGGDATVGEHGIVTVDVSRTHGVRLGGIPVRPELNVSNSIQFQPLRDGGAVAVPDFAMTADETQPVLTLMRAAGWDVGCLYNQETGEDPQLYFSHMIKTGNPLSLAREIRAGLDRTAAVRA
jgi:hypothetical protein